MKKLVILVSIIAAGIFSYNLFLGKQGRGVVAETAVAQENTKIFKTLPPSEAMNTINLRKDLLLVDVRNPDELKNGSIAGSILIPFWDFAKGRFDIPKDQPVLLICAVGGRSVTVGKYLSSIGYTEIYNLKGGIAEWKIVGSLNGEPGELGLADVTRPAIQQLKFKFRYFQDLAGTLYLPDGFEARKVVLSIRPEGKGNPQPVEQEYEWPDRGP